MATAQPKQDRKPILVKELTVSMDHPVDIPGITGYTSNTIMANEQVAIEYRPWMRHHAILVKGQKPKMVHETWCSWIEA